MENRHEKLSELHSFILGVDKEITMILQSLQWDRNHLTEESALESCKYDRNHKVPPDRKGLHEEECFLRSQGYAQDDTKLPAPVDDQAPTLVRLSKEDITQIINYAAQTDRAFKRGPGASEYPPLTAERLQATFTADERRALHDAVVSVVPDGDNVEDLALPGGSVEGKQRAKSKLEILAELRDMRRRRAKYRGASAASSNYSNVLRDVIKTQMELFTGVKEEPKDFVPNAISNTHERIIIKTEKDSEDNGRGDRCGKYKDKHRVERYKERSISRDRTAHDRYEDHRHRNGRSRHGKYQTKYDEIRTETNYINRNEIQIKKERVSSPEEEEEDGHSRSKAEFKRRHEDRRDIEKYSSRWERHRDGYRDDKQHDSSSSSRTKKHREDHHDARSTNRHREHDNKYENSKHRRQDDKYSYDTKRKRHA